MVAGLAFVATAVATLFAQATLVRWSRATSSASRRLDDRAGAVRRCASAALATGASTGWDRGTFRAFYLLGAIVNVPWLALGTVYLLVAERTGRRAHRVVVVLHRRSRLGVMLAAPMHGTSHGDRIPVGKDVFGALPRALAGVGSGLGAIVVFGGAAWSAVRFARRRRVPGTGRLAGGNGLHRARHARALERRPAPGRRRARRGVRAHARDRRERGVRGVSPRQRPCEDPGSRLIRWDHPERH